MRCRICDETGERLMSNLSSFTNAYDVTCRLSLAHDVLTNLQKPLSFSAFNREGVALTGMSPQSMIFAHELNGLAARGTL